MAKKSDCVHHWKIESPNGPTSKGRCKKCKASAEFRNSIPEKSGYKNSLGVRPNGKQSGLVKGATA